ncbi:MAG: iron chaperone [Actinomycetota bacterium]
MAAEPKKKKTVPKDVDGYLAAVPPDARATLETIRETIKTAVPKATEAITYGIPTFKLDGQAFIWFAAWKTHCSLYPVSASLLEAVGENPERFDTAKGTLRFSMDRPPSATLVRKLVKARIDDERAKR